MAKTSEEAQQRIERSKRAKMLRNALGRSRKYMQVNYGISTGTIQYWEDPNIGGVVESSARRLVDIFKAEGLNVSIEWVMYGIGDSPFERLLETSKAVTTEQAAELTDENIITQELKLFYQLNQDAIHLIVKEEDAIPPWLQCGDYVAGKWYFGKEIERAIGVPAIVQLASGQILLRIMNFSRDHKPNRYDLMSIDPTKNEIDSLLQGVKIVSVAPIIWTRKYNSELLSDK